jgi:hypothetical protein
MPRIRATLGTLLLCLTGTASGAAAQSPADSDSTTLPVSIERIRKALTKQPLITAEQTEPGTPTFRVSVEQELVRREPLFEPRDVTVGVLPPGPKGHYEFLRMVTPELARPYAAFNQTELAILTAQTMANAMIARAVNAGIQSARKSIQRRRLERLRRQIAAEVAAINAAASCPGPDKVLPNAQYAPVVARTQSQAGTPSKCLSELK